MIDIARKAGVSRSTVSFVLNGVDGARGIHPETAEKIRRVARQLNFHPNHAAQQLAGKRSGIIAALANNWFYFPLRARLEAFLLRLADEKGIKVLPWQSNDDPSLVARHVHDWDGRGMDGLLYVAFENDAEWPAVAPILAQMEHVVSVIDDPKIPGGSAVVSDVAEGTRQAVVHLHRQGRRRIVQVLNTRVTNLNRRRAEGFIAALRDLGLPCDEQQNCVRIEGNWNDPTEPCHAALCEELIAVRKADAIVADDDFCAAILLRALENRGLRVPDDVAVVGWGNETISRFVVPRLTTVDYRLPEILGTALDLLNDSIERGEAAEPTVVTMQPQLIVRESA